MVLLEKEYDFQKTCRTCLSEYSEPNCIFDIVLSTNDKVPLTDFFRKITSLKVAQDDGLPENICNCCMQQFRFVYDFSQLCIKSDMKLRLQRNRMVLDNIQKEIVEEEEECVNQLELCFESTTEENISSIKSKETDGDSQEIYINDSSDEVLFVFSDEEKSTNKSENVCEVQENSIEFEKSSSLPDNSNQTELKKEKIIRRNRKARPRNFQCPHCPDQFVSEAKLKKHSILHDPSRKYTCETCNKSFSKKYHLSCHMRTHTKDKEFSCEECGKQFAYSYLLKQHSYKHTKEKPFPCKKCGKGCITESSLQRHMKVHDENYERKTFYCDVCSKGFRFPSFLAEHMKNHTGEKPFLCSVCGKGFRQHGALDFHMRSHTGYKPFVCEVCDNRFFSQSVLKVHMRRHTNERPYVCDICGSAFRQSTDLKGHKRVHTGDKSVLCTICGKKMATTGQLTVHIRTHTGEKPFKCKYCDKAFITGTMMRKHERIHTGERPYKCNICEKAFNQRSSLKVHMNTHTLPKKDKTPRQSKKKVPKQAVESKSDEGVGQSHETEIEQSAVYKGSDLLGAIIYMENGEVIKTLKEVEVR